VPLVLAAAQLAVAEWRVWLPADFPLAVSQSLWRVCWIQLWLIAAQLAAREQPREPRLARTLLASVSQAYFPLAAEWRALVSSQRPADFAVQAQRVQRVSGQRHSIQKWQWWWRLQGQRRQESQRQERHLARALLPWSPGLAFVRERDWLWAGLVAPPRHREK
jgi:hypothetical protein